MAKFDWLKERKKQAQREKLQAQPQVNYSAQPVSQRFNTGFGEDGINQPNRPVMQLQTPAGARMIHEGEQFMQLPDGSIRVASQEELMNQEKLGVRGMQRGGIIPPKRQPTAPIAAKPAPGVSPESPFLGGKPKKPRIKGATAQFPGATPAPVAEKLAPFGSIPGTVKPPAMPAPIAEKVEEKWKFGAQAEFPEIAAPVPEAQAVSPDVISPEELPPEVTEEIPTGQDKSYYEKMLEKAMGELEQIMEGGSPAQIAAYQKYIDDLKATQATERMVGAQQAAQGRLGETTAAARGLMMQRMHGISLAGMEAAGGIEQMNAMERATEKLAALGLAGMGHELAQQQFELSKDKFDYGKQLDTINALIAQGGQDNLDQAAMMFQDMYGQDIDFSNALQQENIDKFNQGWNQLNTLIASGMDWEEALKVMEKDGTLDLMGMTQSDVEKMYKQQQLMSDPLYQQMQQIQSWVDQGIITQEQADDLLAIMNHALTNPEGYNVQDGWVVRDEAGNEVGFFTDENAANEFMKDHPDWTSEFMEGHVSKKDIVPEGGGDGDTRLKDFFGREPTAEEQKLFEEGGEIAESFIKDDFRDYSGEDIGDIKRFYDKMPEDWQGKNSLSSIVKRFDQTEGEIIEAFENDEVLKEDYTYEGQSIQDLLGGDWAKYTREGNNRWIFKSDTKKFLKEHKGKMMKVGNKVLVLEDYAEPSSRHSSPTITFKDPKTGEKWVFKCQKGNNYVVNSPKIPGTDPDDPETSSQQLQKYEITNFEDFYNNSWGDDDLSYSDSLWDDYYK